jgi:hypothetical protein
MPISRPGIFESSRRPRPGLASDLTYRFVTNFVEPGVGKPVLLVMGDTGGRRVRQEMGE